MVEEKKVSFVALGGLGEIGMNCMVLQYGEDIIVVDCGVLFPNGAMPGIDLIIPDFTYLIERSSQVKAIFLTHGHEDHIGGLPFLLSRLNRPVYATRFTAGLVTNKLREHNLDKEVVLQIVKDGEVIEAGAFSVEYLNVCHSIADAAALAIRTPIGLLLHSGDFKLDPRPRCAKTNIQRIAGLAATEGVTLLMSDSTNVERPGSSISESAVFERFERLFDEANNRLLITLFASHIDRIAQMLELAQAKGRKVLLLGRSLLTNVALARELGLIQVPDSLFLSNMHKSDKIPDQEVLILLTGCQGEGRSALTRVATGQHEALSIKDGDLVIFSSRSIPGNERAINGVINLLYRQGARVLYEDVADVHTSGHAHKDELRLLIELVRPRMFLPIHGEYRHLVLHADLARSMGIDQVVVASDGDLVELDGDLMTITPHAIPVDRMFVDGRGQGELDSPMLRDRRQLSQAGILLVTVLVDAKTGELVRKPEITAMGVLDPSPEQPGEFMEEATRRTSSALEAMSAKARTDREAVEELVRTELRRHARRHLGKRPVIIPLVVEV